MVSRRGESSMTRVVGVFGFATRHRTAVSHGKHRLRSGANAASRRCRRMPRTRSSSRVTEAWSWWNRQLAIHWERGVLCRLRTDGSTVKGRGSPGAPDPPWASVVPASDAEFVGAQVQVCQASLSSALQQQGYADVGIPYSPGCSLPYQHPYQHGRVIRRGSGSYRGIPCWHAWRRNRPPGRISSGSVAQVPPRFPKPGVAGSSPAGDTTSPPANGHKWPLGGCMRGHASAGGCKKVRIVPAHVLGRARTRSANGPCDAAHA